MTCCYAGDAAAAPATSTPRSPRHPRTCSGDCRRRPPEVTLRVVHCLDESDWGNVAVLRRIGDPTKKGDTWLGGLLTDRSTTARAAWITDGGDGPCPPPRRGCTFGTSHPEAGHQVDQPKGGSGRQGATAPPRAHRPGLATWRAAAQGSRPSAQSAPADKTPSAYLGGDPGDTGWVCNRPAAVRVARVDRLVARVLALMWAGRGGSGTAKPRCGVPDPPWARGGRRC